jgi:hypothetical protein
MRFFFLALVLFIILIIILCVKVNSVKENFFSDSFTALDDLKGPERNPTITFKSNKMKGPDDKNVNEGIVIEAKKSGKSYGFDGEQVANSFPLAVKNSGVDNKAMGVILWQATSKMYEQVNAQRDIIAELTDKLEAIEDRLKKIEPEVKKIRNEKADSKL